ncbi:MAG: glucose-1-phosphate adenylyltransferase, partial [Pseudomonadota bacterium]|nr:glucose-1-phosphate adenylyltransferase [Pseudomonadota bacterium]
ISTNPPLNLYDPDWSTVTHQPQLPPALFKGGGDIRRIDSSMVSGGCVIVNSELSNSLLFSSVRVDNGCILEGVLALPGCEIGAGSKLRNVILDNRCEVPPGTIIGEDRSADAQRFDITDDGIVMVNRRMLGQRETYMPGQHLPPMP